MDTIKRNPIKFGIIFLVIITINIAGWYLFLTWNRPLGEPLDLPTLTPILENTEAPTETPFQPEEEATLEPEVTSSPTATNTPVFTSTPEPVCGGPEYMNILITGGTGFTPAPAFYKG